VVNLAKVALIGNPNSGKTTLFNALAGQNKKTGNWAGVTVSESKAQLIRNNTQFTLVDLPGIYGLSLAELSQDELVVKQAINKNDIDVYVNVLNANNLERCLFLTTEVLDLDVPTILVLNMDDERAASGKVIDVDKLQELTGCPVITTTAINHHGIKALFDAISMALADSPATDHQHSDLPKEIKESDLPDADSRAEAIKQHVKSSDDVISESKAIFDARFQQAMAMAKHTKMTTQPPMCRCCQRWPIWPP
jgi:ferrous iron transport protein B